VLGQLEELRLLAAEPLGQQSLDHDHGAFVVADHVLEEEAVELGAARALELGELVGGEHAGHQLGVIDVLAACVGDGRALADTLQ
jgi:hypothetical protein